MVHTLLSDEYFLNHTFNFQFEFCGFCQIWWTYKIPKIEFQLFHRPDVRNAYSRITESNTQWKSWWWNGNNAKKQNEQNKQNNNNNQTQFCRWQWTNECLAAAWHEWIKCIHIAQSIKRDTVWEEMKQAIYLLICSCSYVCISTCSHVEC